jgi:hypothetical protein
VVATNARHSGPDRGGDEPYFLVRAPTLKSGEEIIDRPAKRSGVHREQRASPPLFFLRINAHDDLSFGREAQQLGASQEINGTIWTLTDIAYTLMAFGEQALLGDHSVAIQHQPHERLRVQPTNE